MKFNYLNKKFNYPPKVKVSYYNVCPSASAVVDRGYLEVLSVKILFILTWSVIWCMSVNNFVTYWFKYDASFDVHYLCVHECALYVSLVEGVCRDTV